MAASPSLPHHAHGGFAVVDVETTGLDPRVHRVIEVAITQVDADGRVEREWSSLLSPRGSTGPVHIHGLTREHLRGAPRFADVAPQIQELLAHRILVAHHAAFDWAFLAHEAARAGVELPVEERLCTVNLARSLEVPTENLKLSTLAEFWNIDPGRAHRAADDVRVLVEVLRRCLAEAGRQGGVIPLEPCRPVTGRRWRVQRYVRAALRFIARQMQQLSNGK